MWRPLLANPALTGPSPCDPRAPWATLTAEPKLPGMRSRSHGPKKKKKKSQTWKWLSLILCAAMTLAMDFLLDSCSSPAIEISSNM